MIETLTSLFLVAGALLMCAGSFGVARFPDFYRRLHSTGIPATLGVSALMVAASIYLSTQVGEIVLKPIISVVILFLTVPLGVEMLARSAYITNVQPWKGYVRDDTEIRGVEHKKAEE